MTPVEAVAKAIFENRWVDEDEVRATGWVTWANLKFSAENHPDPFRRDMAAESVTKYLRQGRAAVLALAEMELPEEVMEASAEAYSDARAASKEHQIAFRQAHGLPVPETLGVAPAEWLPATFRAMLRSVAGEK